MNTWMPINSYTGYKKTAISETKKSGKPWGVFFDCFNHKLCACLVEAVKENNRYIMFGLVNLERSYIDPKGKPHYNAKYVEVEC